MDDFESGVTLIFGAPVDPKLFKDWLSTAEGLGKSVVAVFAIFGSVWAASTKLLDPLFTFLKMPAWSLNAGAALITIGFCFLLWRSFRHFVQASRLEHPDAFTLRPNSPETLVGRDKDLTNLLNSVKKYRLVLLDGESGCGKSALVSAGLVYKLQQGHGLLPVLLRDWGEDWVRGPLSAALDALFHAVDEVERGKLGWTSAPDLAADPLTMLEDLDKRLNAVFNVLSRRPLIIADQFDDYQARHRSRFLDDNASWLSPAALANSNKFWDLISTKLHLGRLHLLVITRADTAAGMSCVRFLSQDQTDTRTLARVEVEYLHLLLLHITADNAHPVIISHPEGGWEKLREYIERDLKLQGAILMQQVRTVLLGLRQLPLLTPKHYYVAGGLRGVETLVISRALNQAGNAAGGGEAGRRNARAILGELVLPSGPNQPPKARRTLLSKLNEITENQAQIESILGTLQHAEVVRPVEAAEGQAWQLDHDYLAAAVLAEARQANRWSIALREGKESFDAASSSWRRRWSSLLSISTLLRVLWERFRKRLRFGEALHYVMMSTLKPAMGVLCIALISVAAVVATQSRLLDAEANQLVSQFGAVGEKDTIIMVWRAPELLRQRVYELIVRNNGNLDRAAKSRWPLAHAGLEPSRVREAALVLRAKLEQERDAGIAASLAQAYATVAARLNDAEFVKTEATALRQRLEQERDAGIAASLAPAYAAVAGRLKETDAIKAGIITLRQHLKQDTSVISSSLLDAYVTVAAQLNDVEFVKAEVTALRQLLEQNSTVKASFLGVIKSVPRAYAAMAARLNDAEFAKAEATALRQLLEQQRKPFSRGSTEELAQAYAAMAAQLNDAEFVQAEATALRHLLEKESTVEDILLGTNDGLAQAYAAVVARLNDAEFAKFEATRLRQLLLELKPNMQAASSTKRRTQAYAAVVARVNDTTFLKAEATMLLQRLEQEEIGPVTRNLAQAYAAVAVQLNDVKASRAGITILRRQLEQEEDSFITGITGSLWQAYAALAVQLNDAEAIKAGITILRQRLEQRGQVSLTVDVTTLAQGYVAMAARLNDAEFAKAEATALRQLLEQEQETDIAAESLVQAYAAVMARVNSPEFVKAEATTLLRRLEQERIGWAVTRNLAQAYAAVAARLNDVEAIKTGIITLRRQLEQAKEKYRAEPLAEAYAVASKRLNLNIDPAVQISEILTLAGSPFIDDTRPLLSALKSLSKVDFGQDLGAAVYWSTTTYGIKPEQLRPPPLNAPVDKLQKQSHR